VDVTGIAFISENIWDIISYLGSHVRLEGDADFLKCESETAIENQTLSCLTLRLTKNVSKPNSIQYVPVVPSVYL